LYLEKSNIFVEVPYDIAKIACETIKLSAVIKFPLTAFSAVKAP
jgi:hypothetical protein